MSANLILPQLLLPATAVELGRFVANIEDPSQDYHDPTADRSSYAAEPKIQKQYNGFRADQARRSFASELISFLSSSISKRSGTTIKVTSDQVKTYHLENSRDWFKSAVQAEETRKWIERTIDAGDGNKMYLVTGYHTLLNACIEVQSEQHHTANGTLVLPVSAALASAGIVMPLAVLADPNVTASTTTTAREHGTFTTEGEQICAVQYRKIRPGWLWSKDVGDMELAGKPVWKRYDRARLRHSDQPDMMEVELEDTTAFGADNDTYVTETGEILLSSLT